MVLDIILGIVLVVMAVRGLGRGIVREALSFAGLTVALFLGAYFYPRVKHFLGDHNWTAFAAFIIIVVAVVFLLNILESLIFYFLRQIKLSFIDFFLGLIIGCIEGVIVVMLILAALVALPMPAFLHIESLINGSTLATFFLPFVDQAHRGWQGWVNAHS